MRGPLRRRDFTALFGASLLAGALPGCTRSSTWRPASRRTGIVRRSGSRHPHPRRARRGRSVDPPGRAAAALRSRQAGAARGRAVPRVHELPAAVRRARAALSRPRLQRVRTAHPAPRSENRLTRDLANVTVDELADAATAAFLLARPLGATISAVGLSLGGTMVLWLAQTQALDLAVPIAPFLIPYPLPPFIGQPAMRFLATLPSMYFWWDFHVKENCLPHYAYPGYPSHALARMVFFGNVIFAAAARTRPRARRCVLVLNELDNAIDNGSARHMSALWNANGAGYTEFVLTGSGPTARRHRSYDVPERAHRGVPQARSAGARCRVAGAWWRPPAASTARRRQRAAARRGLRAGRDAVQRRELRLRARRRCARGAARGRRRVHRRLRPRLARRPRAHAATQGRLAPRRRFRAHRPRGRARPQRARHDRRGHEPARRRRSRLRADAGRRAQGRRRQQSVVEGRWQSFVGPELRDKTLGIIGLGRVGKCVARRARGFAMRVLAADPSATRRSRAPTTSRTSRFDDLLAQADVLSVNASLNDTTRGLLDAGPSRA